MQLPSMHCVLISEQESLPLSSDPLTLYYESCLLLLYSQGYLDPLDA
jgi:hypothetical protein